jgi:hypothetical protein
LKQSISTFLDLFTLPEFQLGVLLGILGLLALVVRSRFIKGQQGWGIVLACLVLYGIQSEVGWQPELFAGIILLGIGGWLKESGAAASESQPQWQKLGAWLVIIAGAGAISLLANDFANPRFVPATILAATATGWSFSRWADGSDRIALGPLFAITAFGIWATIPETDVARLLLGLAVPMAFTTIPPLATQITSAGGFALGGSVVWVALWGGETRSGSVVGAWACIGMIALLPLASRLWGARGIPIWQLAGLHIVAVIVAARVIGLWNRALFAAIGSALLAALLLAVIRLLDRKPAPAE